MRVRLQSSADEQIEGFVDTYLGLCETAGERILSRQNMTINVVHPFASSLSIVELCNQDEWITRLSGTDVCERTGKNPTGRNLLDAIPAEERATRLALVESLFENPCGIRAKMFEKYENGAGAILDTISLPMFGAHRVKMVVNFAILIQDYDHPYGQRSVARETAIISHDYVDLGYGTPDRREEFSLAG